LAGIFAARIFTERFRLRGRIRWADDPG